MFPGSDDSNITITVSADTLAAVMRLAELGAQMDALREQSAMGTDAMAAFGGGLGSLVEAGAQAILNIGLLSAAFGTLTIIQDVAGWVQNLIQQMFQLDEQTQRVVNSWQYLFSQAPGGGKAAGQQLAGWAYQESPKLPFTAVDLRSGISTLGTIPGMTPAQIERFMPVLADIASTLGASDYGGQGINLQQAAQAIVGAQFGLTRQLRYELHINPDELLKYGLVGKATATGLRITDQSTLIPAIMRWAQARGLVGAAQEQETSTFWGAYSSFQDYIQNFLQSAGGIDPATGQVRKGSMFGDLQNLLINVNTMLAQGQVGGGKSIIGQLMGTTGNILGGATSAGGSILSGLLSGIGAGGGGVLGGDLLTKLQDFGTWLSSSQTQHNIEQLAKAFGDLVGQGMKEAAALLPELGSAFKDLGNSAGQLWNSFTPAQQAGIKDFIGMVIQGILPGIIENVASGIRGLAAAFQLLGNVNRTLQGIETTIQGWAQGLIRNFRTWAGDMIQAFIQGIESHIPNVAGAAQHVGDVIRQFLAHSKPQIGPLADDDQWMPDMLRQFASTMDRGLPELQSASMRAAQTIAQPFTGSGSVGGASFMASFTTVNGMSPYQQGQTFVEQFVNGAVSHIQQRGSPLALAFSQIMTEVATEIVNESVQMINRSAYSATVVPGGYRVFGAMGAKLGGL